MRVGRKGIFRFDQRACGEHAVLEGKVIYLDVPYLHADQKPLGDWVRKHVRYAEHKAGEQLRERIRDDLNPPSFFGSADQRVRWLRNHVYTRLPRFARAGAYFFYRYVLQQGFRDGVEGLAFHFLKGFWLQFLVNTYLLEEEVRRKRGHNVSGKL